MQEAAGSWQEAVVLRCVPYGYCFANRDELAPRGGCRRGGNGGRRRVSCWLALAE